MTGLNPFFSSLTPSITPHFGVNQTPGTSPVHFGGQVDELEREDKDTFTRNTPANNVPAPEEDLDPDFMGPEETQDGEKPKTDHANQLIKNSTTLEITDATAPAIQRLRSHSTEQLKQVISRRHLTSAVLTYDDERLKNGVLAQLQSHLNSPMIELDCSDIKPEKSGFFDNKKVDHKLVESLEKAIPHLEVKFATNPNQPLVLILNNVNNDELSNLQNAKVYKKLQSQFPNIRIIVPTELSSDGSGNSKPFSWMDDDKDSGVTPWRAGQFQIVNIPTLKPNEWAKVIKQDPLAQQVLGYWNIDASENVLNEFFNILKRENQDNPLSYDSLIAELDALGSFIKSEDTGNSSLSSKDIKDYTRKVLAARRTHAPTSGGPVSMGPPPYDTINAGDINVQMDDIVGHEDAKKVLTQALEASKYPNVFAHLNENDPDAHQSMVMLMGAPGGGKTLLAKAVAAQGGASFISTSGSRFVNGLVGGGANAIRRLRDAIEQAPDDLVVLFIDELDALGSRSGMGGEMGASGSEDLKTINEFLAFTDGVKKISNKRVLILGATNRPEATDPAILSRFNQKLEIQELSRKQREELIQKQMDQKGLYPDHSVDIKSLAKRTNGFSGRDIRNFMINVKNKLIREIPTEQLEMYEQNPERLKELRLSVSHKDLIEGIREVKRSNRQIKENEKSGEYSGGDKPAQNGGRKMYAITA